MNINLAYIFTDNVMLLVSRSMYVCMYAYTCSCTNLLVTFEDRNRVGEILEWESNEFLEPVFRVSFAR